MDAGNRRAGTPWREVAVLAALGVVLSAGGAALLAQDRVLFGTFGDSEQLIWQTRNLLKVVESGSWIISDAFFGVDVPYAYMPTSFGEALAISGLRLLSGNVWFAYNFGVLCGMAANFVSMYACLRAQATGRPAAFLGGLVYLFAPQTAAQGIAGHMWLVWTFLLPPLFVLVAQAGRDVRGSWWPKLAVVTSLLVWIHEYLWLFGAGVAAVAIAITVIRRGASPARPLALALVAAGLLLLPFVSAQVSRAAFERNEPDASSRYAALAEGFSSVPTDYIRPSDSSLLYLEIPPPVTRPFAWETLNYLGLIPMIAAVLLVVPPVRAKVDPDQLRFLIRTAPVALVAFVVSLGAHLPPIRALYDLDVSPVSDISAWGRFGVFAFVWFAFAAAAVAHALLRPLRDILVIAFVLVATPIVVVDQYPFFDVVSHSARAPSRLISTVRSSPVDTYVMHVPLDPSGVGRYNAMAQFLQTFHERPIVNGYMSLIRGRYYEQLSGAPIACLQAFEIVAPRCPSPSALGRYLTASNVGWVVLDRFQTQITTFSAENPFRVALRIDRIETVLNRLEEAGYLTREYADDDYVLFRVSRL